MRHRSVRHITVVGGGFAGLTAAITCAEAGAQVTLYEAHDTLGGRARTSEGAYRTNEGPHAFYASGPHWTWLAQRGLTGPLAKSQPRDCARPRFRYGGRLRRMPPLRGTKTFSSGGRARRPQRGGLRQRHRRRHPRPGPRPASQPGVHRLRLQGEDREDGFVNAP
jgi:protoporphyrinogen oxidase